MFPTPSNAQTMKTDRPAGVLGVKSPYPTVLKASKPTTRLLRYAMDEMNGSARTKPSRNTE